MRLNEHRSKPAGLGDILLADRMAADGVLQQQDGSYVAIWDYRGPDLASADPSAMNAMSERVNKLLMLGTGWMVQFDVIRVDASGYDLEQKHFPTALGLVLDQERQQQFETKEVLFRSEYFFTLTYLPPKALVSKVKSAAIGRKEATASEPSLEELHLDRFERKCDEMEEVLRQSLGARRLRAVTLPDGTLQDELLRFVHRCITGKNHPISLPDIPTGLNDTILASEDFVGGFAPKIGKQYIACVAISGFPKFSRPGIMAALDRMQMPYRWSTRAVILSARDAGTWLETQRKRWSGNSRGFREKSLKGRSARITSWHAVDQEADVVQAQKTAEGQWVQFAWYNATVVLMDASKARLRQMVLDVITVIEGLGYACREEETNAVEAWRGSLPGDGYSNVRRVQLHTMNLADMLPLTAVWEGLKRNPSKFMKDACPLMLGETTGATPFRVHFHVRELAHVGVIGPSGNGKSTFLGLTAAQWFRYPDAQVFFFDYDYSSQILINALGGKFYDLMGDDKQLSFAPLRNLSSGRDVVWACRWIEDLCKLSGLSVSPDQRNYIAQAMRGLQRSPSHRTLTNFVGNCQDEDVRAALLSYTLEGDGEMLDAERDSLDLGSRARIIGFETKRLMDTNEPRLMLPALLYIFRRVEQRLDGRPTLIILDEAHAYLKHEVFRDHIERWLRTVRRRNGVVILASQEVSDFVDSPIAQTLMNQTATKILLPNQEAMNATNQATYRKLGCNDSEIRMLANGVGGRDYYFSNAYGKRMVNLAMNGVVLSFCGINDPERRLEAERLMQSDPMHWRSEWLRVQGHADWANHLRSMEVQEAKCATA